MFTGPVLDPGTVGLKGTFNLLLCVGLVARVVCLKESCCPVSVSFRGVAEI